WLAASSVAPRHVSQGLLRLWRGDNGAPPVELSPIAGDLSITYLYPAYTGLPPRTEEGTAGDLHAPRGTEVRIAARADRDLAQAFAVVNGAVIKLDAQAQGHRQLSGTFTLTQPGPAKRLRGAYTWEIAPLKLRAGDKVSYHLEAKDNDAVDGAQKGVSATQAIKIFSAAEHSREALIHAQALWERLVALLADRLEEKPPPPEGEPAAQWYAQTSQKDRDGRVLSSEMSAAGTELLKDKLAPRAVGRALRYASTSLGPALQRTSIARAPLARGSLDHEGAVRNFGVALANEIKEEEKDVLYLEDLLDRARLDAMQELGKELAASRRELARLAEKLRKANDEETKKELLSEVERMRERI